MPLLTRRHFVAALGAALATPALASAQPLPPTRDDYWQRRAAAPSGARELAMRALGTPRRVSQDPAPEVSARYVAVLDERSGVLLHGVSERTAVPMASVTKIATTLVALERAPSLEQRIPVTIDGPAMAARNGSSIMGLEPGENVSLKTLLYGMMLPSGNDASEQVAVSLASSRAEYLGWMNDYARRRGLLQTGFATPSGMDATGHYSSAYDLVRLGRIAMQNADFRAMAAARTYRADGYNLRNINRFLDAYRGADGIKTGFTGRAGRTMVASVKRGEQRVYVAILRSDDLVADATALFDWTFRVHAWDA